MKFDTLFKETYESHIKSIAKEIESYEETRRKMSEDEPEKWRRLVDHLVRLDHVRIPKDQYTEEEVKAAVFWKYPDIGATMRLNMEINRDLPREHWHRASIKVTSTDKHYTKIGFRDVNQFTSLPKLPKDKKDISSNTASWTPDNCLAEDSLSV